MEVRRDSEFSMLPAASISRDGGNSQQEWTCHCHKNSSTMLFVDFGAGQFGCVCFLLIHKPSGVGIVIRIAYR